MAGYQTQPTDAERLAHKAHAARMALVDFWQELLRQRGGEMPAHQYGTTLKVFQAVTSALAGFERGQR